jgi:hypothetical protein
MQPSAALEFTPVATPLFLELWVLSEFHDLSQRLTIDDGERVQACALPQGWSPLSVPVSGASGRLAFSVNKAFPREYYPTDTRTLAVRMRGARLHQDAERHTHIARQTANMILNQEETLAGRAALSSTPPNVGIDLIGVCNVKPPCVYCEWDFSKAQEGDHVDVPFTSETLREWGPYFDNAVNLINCSIGEPFMMKNIDELFGIFGRTGKVLQMTTNGQILTDRNIQKIVGLPIDLYLSLDAATPQTYAQLRNNTFDRILGNIRRLIAAKGGRGQAPFLHLVFMPMRCNLHELEDFVRLCADLQVDRLVLRPLNYSDSITLDWTRAGYRFEYQKELLPFDTLIRASGRAARLAERLGVELADQMDFGGGMREQFREAFERGVREADEILDAAASAPVATGDSAATPAGATAPDVTSAGAAAMPATTRSDPRPAADTGPDGVGAATSDTPTPVGAAAVAPPLPSLGEAPRAACLEPWKSLYILRRGILPCCYGGAPIATMEEYDAAWNSPTLQAIRTELARGRFHEYCQKSPACPIVRKSEHARSMEIGQRVVMRTRHAWWRLNRQTNQRLNTMFYHPLKRLASRALRGVGAR